jgi:hypothetical protein
MEAMAEVVFEMVPESFPLTSALPASPHFSRGSLLHIPAPHVSALQPILHYIVKKF